MSAEKKKNKYAALGRNITLRLQDPEKLRVAILATIAVIGLAGVGIPLHQKIKTLRAELDHEKQRQVLIREHRYVESRMKRFRKRVPKNADMDWWITYFLDASRQAEVKIIEYKPFKVKGKRAKVGKLQGIFLRFDLVGPFKNMLQFIGKMENQKGIVRISRVLLSQESPSSPLKTIVMFGVLTSKNKKKARPDDSLDKKTDQKEIPHAA